MPMQECGMRLSQACQSHRYWIMKSIATELVSCLMPSLYYFCIMLNHCFLSIFLDHIIYLIMLTSMPTSTPYVHQSPHLALMETFSKKPIFYLSFSPLLTSTSKFVGLPLSTWTKFYQWSSSVSPPPTIYRSLSLSSLEIFLMYLSFLLDFWSGLLYLQCSLNSLFFYSMVFWHQFSTIHIFFV